MIDKEDLEQWESLPLVSNVLTSAQMGAWLYYREENMRKRIREQTIMEVKHKLPSVYMSDATITVKEVYEILNQIGE